jgi:hypothetical protein
VIEVLKCYVKRKQHETLNCKEFQEGLFYFDDVVVLCALREGLENRLRISKASLEMESEEAQEFIKQEIKTLEDYIKAIDNEICFNHFEVK